MGNESHDFLPELGDQEGPQQGPSWSNPAWLTEVVDSSADLTAALDPTQMRVVVAKAAEKAGKQLDDKALEKASDDSNRAMMLVRTFRVRGHLAANLDPLGLSKREIPEDLTLKGHGFEGEEDLEVYVGGVFGFGWVTIGELYDALRHTYCGNVGLEYMHISDTVERRFLQERFETPEETIQFTDEGKRAILAAVIRGEQYESFLGKKYVGTKRFGLDGGESMIPALEAVIKYGGQQGVREIIYGMAHRGRLNVLANVMGKPYKVIFHEFSGGSANPEDVGGSGDVKYHLGTSTDREFDGIDVHMSLVPNPSHLEAVDPVVLGKARAQQAIRDDLKQHEQVLPVLLHGDAAFAGQGIVWECLGFSGVRGYNTGGCLHFVINNQIGFTTSPQFARSSPYPSDVAKGVQAPILHVNGDDPEAVTFACKLAIEYRQTFGRDIVIDMWCYRRFGHNEGDEPGFTQPLMYAKIRQHPPVSALYADRLVEQGVIDKNWKGENEDRFTATLESEFQAANTYKANEADWFGGRWSGLNKPADPVTARRNVATGIERKLSKYKDVFEKKHGVKLGLMSFFAKASVLALKDIPSVNAQIQGEEIVYFDYVDISVAVSAPNGLVVPVVRDVDKMSFADIEKAIADYGKKARDGALTMADMAGGTFTISNGGVFGGLMSTPIINPPQSAVLGLHRIEDRPVVRNGQIVIRPMMYIALSYDHRIIDGREAVTALKTIKEAIEDPTRLLIDL